tara:strand:+ start:4997 stop:5842 length:846 start_codon:yes stop_codon:yes gene_type:complete
MSIKSNVQEITTSTGIGNITLTGVSDDGRTFTSQYSLNDRFTYYIDDRSGSFETGIGYLSAASTLVREKPLEGSAALPVNFGAGTKQVFVNAGAANLTVSSLGFNSVGSTVKFMMGSNLSRINSTQAIVANRQYFFEAPFLRGALVDLIGVQISSGGGTSANKMHIGLYDVDPLTGQAGNLILEATNLDPSVAGLISGSFTERFIQAGVYIFSIWSDVTVTVKANDATIRDASILGSSSSLGSNGHDFTSSLSSLTSLPSPAVVTNNNTGGKLMCLAIGHT